MIIMELTSSCRLFLKSATFINKQLDHPSVIISHLNSNLSLLHLRIPNLSNLYKALLTHPSLPKMRG